MISFLMGGRRALHPPLPFVTAEVFCCAVVVVVVVVARGVDSLGGAAISVPMPMPIPALLRLSSLSDEMSVPAVRDDEEDDDRPSAVDMGSLTASTSVEPTATIAAPPPLTTSAMIKFMEEEVEVPAPTIS